MSKATPLQFGKPLLLGPSVYAKIDSLRTLVQSGHIIEAARVELDKGAVRVTATWLEGATGDCADRAGVV
jgi:hypothetical protein